SRLFFFSRDTATPELYPLSLHDALPIYIDDYGTALAAVQLDGARSAVAAVIPPSEQLMLVVIGKAEAIRDGLRKYGPLTEMKLRSEEHTSELQSRENLVCRLLLEKKNKK